MYRTVKLPRMTDNKQPASKIDLRGGQCAMYDSALGRLRAGTAGSRHTYT